MSCMRDQMRLRRPILPERLCREQRERLHVASRSECEERDTTVGRHAVCLCPRDDAQGGRRINGKGRGAAGFENIHVSYSIEAARADLFFEGGSLHG